MKIGALVYSTAALGLVKALDLRGYSLVEHPDPVKRAELQDIVTWDEKSMFINGERLMLFSGEIHPFRLPVPSLWLDIFQKLKGAGFNCVSFYTNWALHEGQRGDYNDEGIFDLQPFYDAAKEAGIYLIARPGPYINAEVSGGGFPGWMQRVKSPFRASNPDYLQATENYMKHIAGSMAKAQITNGGPIILFQPENEYSLVRNNQAPFPDGSYMQHIINQARNAGILVPMISNDVAPRGHNAPGTGVGQVDIYGYDAYPLGFNCAQPSVWPPGNLPTNWRRVHLQQSPNTPHAVLEFQAGSYDPWAGNGYDECAKLLNHEFTRVFNKNNIGFGITILNLYMTFGGTNWGNLGYPRGYTSYDYGASIAEDRSVSREKYSETKLLAHFIKACPAYLQSVPGDLTQSLTTTNDLSVTPLRTNTTAFWVIRHSAYQSLDTTEYNITLPTSRGNMTIPQLRGSLALHGRDSKILSTDVDLGNAILLYSSAEIFTSSKIGNRQILVLYGGPGEHHEFALQFGNDTSRQAPQYKVSTEDASSIESKQADNILVFGWDTSEERRIIDVGELRVILLGRNAAYNYWVTELQGNSRESVIINGPYVVRRAEINGNSLRISADFNQTTSLEIVAAPASLKDLYINDRKYKHTVDDIGVWSTEVRVEFPGIKLPDFNTQSWKYLDSLPEIKSDYDDSAWTNAHLEKSYNDYRNLSTPVSLWSGDYGYHSGILNFRGRFRATGNESDITLWTQGGWGSLSAVWLNDKYLGSSTAYAKLPGATKVYSLPKLKLGEEYILTVLQDHQGYELNPWVGDDEMKSPRGILNYTLNDHSQDSITWKLTGNLGGEDYADRVRGPLNEGGSFIERQGFHQPSPPTHRKGWSDANPISDGIKEPGIGYFTTSFDLKVPKGWDVPLYFTFGNETAPPPSYRVQLFVNGYNFGRYINTLGPQTSFYVPQGILNYDGKNWVGLTIWGQEANGVSLDGLKLEYKMPVLSGMQKVKRAPQPRWKERKGAY